MAGVCTLMYVHMCLCSIQSRRWRPYWRRRSCCSGSCKTRMCLRGTTSSIWPRDSSSTSQYPMTSRRAWYQSLRWVWPHELMWEKTEKNDDLVWVTIERYIQHMSSLTHAHTCVHACSSYHVVSVSYLVSDWGVVKLVTKLWVAFVPVCLFFVCFLAYHRCTMKRLSREKNQRIFFW